MMFPRADLRTRHAGLAAAALGLGALAFSMTGCGEEEPPPPPPPPPRTAPPPPPPPDRVATEALLEFENAPDTVEFPNSAAPYDRGLAEAVIAFASALASGDDLALAGMLDPTGRAVLDQLVSSGEWFVVTDEIETVRVAYLTQQPDETTNASSARFILAVKERQDDAYVLGWDAARASGDAWIFAAFETTDATRPTASAWDSDSSGDFMPGSDAFGGMGLGGQAFDPAAELEQDPAGAYIALEMTTELLRIAGLSGLENQAVQAMADQFGVTPDRLRAVAAEGRDEVVNGGPPDPILVSGFIMSARAVATALGSQIEDQQIVEAIAKVFQVDTDEARRIFEQASP